MNNSAKIAKIRGGGARTSSRCDKGIGDHLGGLGACDSILSWP